MNGWRLTSYAHAAGAGDATSASLGPGTAFIAVLAVVELVGATLPEAATAYVAVAGVCYALAHLVDAATAVRAADAGACGCICGTAELAGLEGEEAAEKWEVGLVGVEGEGGLEGW